MFCIQRPFVIQPLGQHHHFVLFARTSHRGDFAVNRAQAEGAVQDAGLGCIPTFSRNF